MMNTFNSGWNVAAAPINWLNAASGWGMVIADHPDTPSETLSTLARHPDVGVRTAVADHRNTLTEILMLLAGDEKVDLRYAIAENHNIDASVLSLLTNDENPYVAHRAAKTLARLKGASIVQFQQLISQATVKKSNTVKN